MRTVTLPPPAGTILLYAADGLSARQGDLSPAGRPRAPRRSIWVPLFRNYIETSEGLTALHSLARDGMAAWGCSADQLDGLTDAFGNISFKALSIAALEYFAATADQKIEWFKKATPIAPSPVAEIPLTDPSQAPVSHNNKDAKRPSHPNGRPPFRNPTP